MLPKKFVVLASLVLSAALTLPAAKLPRPMFDAVMDTQGLQKRFHLIDTRGKVRVVLLVSVDCSHCDKVVAVFSKVEREYRDKGVQFLGATVNTNTAQDLSKFLSKTKPSFLVGSLRPEEVMALADFKENERPFVPMVLFVDKNNYVQYQYNGDGDFFKDPNKGNGVLKTKARTDDQQAEFRLRSVLDAMLKK